MKLLAKYNRVYIPITIAALAISSIAGYFIVHYMLLGQLDKDLIIEKQEILHHVKQTGVLPEASNYKDQQVKFRPGRLKGFEQRFSIRTESNNQNHETEVYRQLEFPVVVNGKEFIASVSKSQQETEDIVALILEITFSIIAFLLLVLFIVNRFLLAKLWQPFKHTLTQLKDFNLSSKNELKLLATNTDEFAELNATAFQMTRKMSKDYESLKSFTEHASHEIQTPLAIIKAQLELFLQWEHLAETQAHSIQIISEATNRLSKLNHSLLLLTKIENRQYAETGEVDISCVLNSYIEHFEELSQTKNIKIYKSILPAKKVSINESLAEILISNLITNAIKHNDHNGIIQIELNDSVLEVRNTGKTHTTDTQLFFERFKKESAYGDSLGLGLSIVKKICETYGFPVTYFYREELHVISIRFATV